MIFIEEISRKNNNVKEESMRKIVRTQFFNKIYDDNPVNKINIEVDDEIYDIHKLNDWIIPNDFIFLYNTKNQFNYTHYIAPYNNSFLEIWQNKKCNDETLFLVREIIITMIKRFSCSKTSDYACQSHIYCMIKNFLIQKYENEKVENCVLELTEKTNLFLFAEKHKINIVIRLILECDLPEKGDGYHLSVVRIPKKRKNPFFDSEFTKKEIKEDLKYAKDNDLLDLIKNFNYEKFECKIEIRVYENSNVDESLNKIKDFFYKNKLDNNQLNNKNLSVIISEQEIFVYLNETKTFAFQGPETNMDGLFKELKYEEFLESKKSAKSDIDSLK